MAKDNNKKTNPTPAAQSPAPEADGTGTADQNASNDSAKAKAGTSVSARARKLISALFTEIGNALAERFDGVNLTDLMSAETAAAFSTLAGEINSGATKGLPLATQLAQAQDKRNEIFSRAKVVDGKMAWASDADEKMVDQLGAKILRLQTAIKKAKDGTTETEAATPATA